MPALTWPRTAVNACVHREPASPGRMHLFGPSETPGAARRQPERQSRITKPGRKEYSDTPPLWLSLHTFRFGSNVLNVGPSIQRPTWWWRDATRQHACVNRLSAIQHSAGPSYFLWDPLLEIPRSINCRRTRACMRLYFWFELDGYSVALIRRKFTYFFVFYSTMRFFSSKW